MMNRLFVSLTILLPIALAAIAGAQEPPITQPQGGGMRFQMPSFEDLDKNKDKKLSRDELPAQFPQQFFDRLDENKDGVIDEEEWGRRFRGGGGNVRLSELLTRFMDVDKDGKVTRAEFGRITEVFDALDQNKDGELSQDEMGRFFQAVNEVQAQATGGVEVDNLFEKFDKNKDGKITADEMASEREFRALDINKDGSVTREEADQALKRLAERSRQRMGSRP